MNNQWETAIIVCVITLIGSFATQRILKIVDKKYSRDLKLFEKSFQACENLLSDAIPLTIFLRIPVLVNNDREYYLILDMLQTPQKFSDTVINFRDKYSKYEVYLDYKAKLISRKLIYYMRMQELLFYKCFINDPRKSPHYNIYNNCYLSIAMSFSRMYEEDCINLIQELNIHNSQQLGGKITKRKFTALAKNTEFLIQQECDAFFESSSLSKFEPIEPIEVEKEKLDSINSQEKGTKLIAKTKKSMRTIRKHGKIFRNKH